ncbi:MAG TPA: hypothetical protein DD381_00155 [Lentisphaeria bacterium]|nr:MAG: hypothetical protein A2X47_12965 [Lentisphaerae bacterium GWF2_38_69]HBM14753.1 hypothetical protein [Lentisphaeria bacterium]
MIDFQNVSKQYSKQIILQNTSFRINSGERVGIVGPNGAGKSTIFKIITGDETADKGNIIIPKNFRLSYLKQNLETSSLHTSLLEYTENAIPEIHKIKESIEKQEESLAQTSDDKKKASILSDIGDLHLKLDYLHTFTETHKIESALSGLGFDKKRFGDKFSSFSGGWQMRASLARTILSQGDILLLDEPSNYLDVPAIEWMKKTLESYKGTLVLISHDRYLLNSLTNTTIEVNSGTVTKYSGNYDYYSKERVQRQEHAQAARENREAKVKDIEDFIERFRYKATKANQVQSRIKMLGKMEEIKAPQKVLYHSALRLPEPPSSGNEIIRVEEGAFSYNNRDFILEDINLSIQKKDKIGLVGYNGAGKTTLLKVLAGVNKLNSGKCVTGHNVKIGYQAQEFSEILSPNITPYETLRALTIDTSNLRNILGCFGFSGEDAEKPCSVLSGGEKIRLLFARIFCLLPNFLILDEPTTHLDIVARENLQKAIKEYEGTVCFVSHDIEFLKKTADTIFFISGNRVKKYHGNYDYFLEKLSKETEASIPLGKEEKVVEESKLKRKQKAEIRQKFYTEKKELENKVSSIEKSLEELEEEKAEIVEQITENTKSANFASINRRLQEIQTEINALTIQWEESATNLETALKRHSLEIESFISV